MWENYQKIWIISYKLRKNKGRKMISSYGKWYRWILFARQCTIVFFVEIKLVFTDICRWHIIQMKQWIHAKKKYLKKRLTLKCLQNHVISWMRHCKLKPRRKMLMVTENTFKINTHSTYCIPPLYVHNNVYQQIYRLHDISDLSVNNQ